MAAIPAWFDLVVGGDLIDANQHLNIRHHFLLGALAVGEWYEELGLGEEYREVRRLSLFTAEQHLKYHHEVSEGARITVHPRLLARGRGALHARSFIVDRHAERLACSMEIVLVHVSLDSRRSAPFEADAAAALDAAIAGQSELDWDPAAGSVLWRGAAPHAGESA